MRCFLFFITNFVLGKKNKKHYEIVHNCRKKESIYEQPQPDITLTLPFLLLLHWCFQKVDLHHTSSSSSKWLKKSVQLSLFFLLRLLEHWKLAMEMDPSSYDRFTEMVRLSVWTCHLCTLTGCFWFAAISAAQLSAIPRLIGTLMSAFLPFISVSVIFMALANCSLA